ncbi:hypothetical protein LBMAG53_28370 [Planctomycetota bacterium]|nr:hypothetical protein LBMAG53_28370 [Planctomycetota bacterium]
MPLPNEAKLADITLPVGCIDPERVAATFATHGVVILPSLFSIQQMQAARESLLAWAATPSSHRPSNHGAVFQVHQTAVVSWGPIQAGDPAFIALRDHPLLRSLTAAAIGLGATGNGCLVMLSRNGHRQAWHQDTSSADPGQFVLNRLLYLWDIDPQAGTLYCVPGSHRRGIIPPGEPHESLPDEVGLAPRAGTLVLIHSRCFHRVSVNATHDLRFSVNFRAQPAGSTEHLDRYGVYRTGTHDFVTNKAVV